VIDLSRIVKAYDVRGTVPDQLNEPVAEALGRAFVQTLRSRGEYAEKIVTAHDMRASGPALVAAFAAGARAEGADIVEAGLGSTDLRSTTGSNSASRAPSRSGRTPASPRSASGRRRCSTPGRPGSPRPT
jgi:phosphomannomutase